MVLQKYFALFKTSPDAEIFKFTDGCHGCSAVLTPRKPFGFCQGLSRFAIHVYNACFDGYPSRRMTSAMDCVASYIASAFSFCSLVYIIPSFLPVQDFVRRVHTDFYHYKERHLCFLLIRMNYEKQKQLGGKDEQFRLFVLFVLRKAL